MANIPITAEIVESDLHLSGFEEVGPLQQGWLGTISERMTGLLSTHVLSFAGGILVGGALAVFLDPIGGARRRALVRDKAVHVKNVVRNTSKRQARHYANHAKGLVAKTQGRHNAEDLASDEVLVQRIRSEFGRQVSHPRSVHVSCEQGVATLSGPILAYEVHALLKTVGSVRGVTKVINNLDVHVTPAHISGLQGEGKGYIQ